MPAGFAQTDALSHLEGAWGLDTNRRTAVLCYCVTMEPPSRLSDIESAQSFFDTVVARYGKHAGVSVQMRSTLDGSGQPNAIANMVDAAGLEALKKDQNEFLYKQFQLYLH